MNVPALPLVTQGESQVMEVLDFDSEEFRNMSVSDRVKKCRSLAQRARALAAQSNHESTYLRIAIEWDTLADDMQQAQTTDEGRPSAA
jgi:hypothetical protein